MLGIARTTRAPDGRWLSIVAVSMPAATDTTSAPGGIAEATSRSTRSRICGLTDSTRISACLASAALSVVVSMR
jgi:hypothetical protein